MANDESVFSLEEEERIVNAIREAENKTSGEIRVHISQSSDEEGGLEKTQRLFVQMRMMNTVYRNAVLIHISLGSKTFAIFGDEGINDVVQDDFWESTKEIMANYFKQNKMVDGICAGVENVGEQLKVHFPFNNDDSNELSNEVTYDNE